MTQDDYVWSHYSNYTATKKRHKNFEISVCSTFFLIIAKIKQMIEIKYFFSKIYLVFKFLLTDMNFQEKPL